MATAFPFVPVPEPQETPLAYGEMFGAQPAMATAPQMGYASAMQPQPQEAAQALYKPTNDPQEIAARAEGWQQVVQRLTSDPNLMRAIGYAGAALMQPMERGQTTAGHLGRAFTIGSSAYSFGQEAEFQRQMAMRKEGREQAESEATVGLRKAQTSEVGVRTAGMQTENEIREATKQDAIAKIQLDRQKAQQDLDNAKTVAEQNRIKLDWEKRVADIKKTIPDAALRADLENDLKKSGLENLRIQAQTHQADAAAAESAADAREKTAKAKREELELKDLENMTPAERANARLKRGAGANLSAQVQMAEWYKNNLKAGNKDMSDEEAARKAAEWLSSKKVNNAELFVKFAELMPRNRGETDDQYVERVNKLIDVTGGGGSAAPRTGTLRAVPGPGSGRGTPAPAKAAPAVGTVLKGYKFKGGDPADPKNWEKVN